MPAFLGGEPCEAIGDDGPEFVDGSGSGLSEQGLEPLRKAPQRLAALRTPEGVPIPPNTLDEIRRDMDRLAVVREQINAIEMARIERLEKAPAAGPHAMVRLLARVVGVGMETADMPAPTTLQTNAPPSCRDGFTATILFHNTHLSMSLKRIGFADRDAIPRGIWGFVARDEQSAGLPAFQVLIA